MEAVAMSAIAMAMPAAMPVQTSFDLVLTSLSCMAVTLTPAISTMAVSSVMFRLRAMMTLSSAPATSTKRWLYAMMMMMLAMSVGRTASASVNCGTRMLPKMAMACERRMRAVMANARVGLRIIRCSYAAM